MGAVMGCGEHTAPLASMAMSDCGEMSTIQPHYGAIGSLYSVQSKRVIMGDAEHLKMLKAW